MTRKYLTYAIIPVMALTLIGVGTASAHGWYGLGGTTATPDQIAQRQQASFDAEAALLGVSVDTIKNAWAQGKSIVQVAQDNGITKAQLQQKMLDAKKATIALQLKALVDKGVITQAQADQRLKAMETMTQNMKNGKIKMGMGMKLGHFKFN